MKLPATDDATVPDWEIFRNFPHAITLLGMSGVGKTWLSTRLRLHSGWFHFSADYRIGTRYLAEAILDNIKYKIMCMADPFVADLLRSDSIYINHNIGVDNLEPVSTFLGLYGADAQGGLPKSTFLSRQKLYSDGEIGSMIDVDSFLDKAYRIYGCNHFVNDSSGSLCEIIDLDRDDDPVLRVLTENTLIIYLRAENDHEDVLCKRAERYPKPLYYHPDFLIPNLESMPEDGEGVEPHDFARARFVDLLNFRRPRYAALAQHGLTVDTQAVIDAMGESEGDDSFLSLIYQTLQDGLDNKAEHDRVAVVAARYFDACRRRLTQRNG